MARWILLTASLFCFALAGFADGSQQTTQTTIQVNPAIPSASLALSGKVVQTIRPTGAATTEREIQVQWPDVNGALQTTAYQRVAEKKQ